MWLYSLNEGLYAHVHVWPVLSEHCIETLSRIVNDLIEYVLVLLSKSYGVICVHEGINMKCYDKLMCGYKLFSDAKKKQCVNIWTIKIHFVCVYTTPVVVSRYVQARDTPNNIIT